MNPGYSHELRALKRSGRYRERQRFDASLADLASNDYLGLAERPDLAREAFERLERSGCYGAKASMLVNGYHDIHAAFEAALCTANGFEAGIVVGNGFGANLGMIEALVRKGDELFIDEKYHASGILATRLCDGKVTYFTHNDPESLEMQLKASKATRRIVAVEGIYSMDGDMLDRRIIDLAAHYDAYLIIDEAHSSGIVGSRLMGVLDHFGAAVTPRMIKMGTLGKAYGGYGAYILASGEVVDYLVNRAKPVIYATAPSLFETAKAHGALEYILENAETLGRMLQERRDLLRDALGMEMPGLIAPVPVGDNRRVMEIRDRLLEAGILAGAIRQPTVPRAIIRLIPRLGVDAAVVATACRVIREVLGEGSAG